MMFFFVKYPYLLNILISSVVLFVPLSGNIQAIEQKKPIIEALLKIEEQENQSLTIIGVAKNLSEKTLELRYELSVTVSNKKNNNSSKSAQSGSFSLAPSESQDLSKSTVSTGQDSKSVVLLSIYQGAVLLKKIEKTYGGTH